MILVICHDDPTVLDAARRSQHADPAHFGQLYTYPLNGSVKLAPNENLFIIAHGDKKEIGNHQPGTGVDFDPVRLANHLTVETRLLSAGHVGGVYFSTCFAANYLRSTGTSYIERFQAVVEANIKPGPAPFIYGQSGEAAGKIPLPGDKAWTQLMRH